MHYEELHEMLGRLEARVSTTRPSEVDLDSLVRDIPSRTPVQAFGLSKHTEGRDLKVVVAIGINYTQGKTKCPRDGLQNERPERAEVVDGLGSCRNWLQKLFSAYRERGEEWKKNRCASSAAIEVPPDKDFHLIMTNFCLWVTKDTWAEVRKKEAQKDKLLRNNPLFEDKPTRPPDWPHLARLFEELHQAQTIWVPHGITGDVPSLFFEFIRARKAMDWIFAPNLSRPYDYSGTRFPRELAGSIR